MHPLDTLYIKTYGCAMNEYDSSRMIDVMKKAYGLKLVATPEEADVVLLNTCSIREKAEDKVYSELGRLNKIKKKRPHMLLGVGGCVAQQEGKRIQQRAPYVDLVFGPQTYHRLPEMIKELRRKNIRLSVTDMPEIEKFDFLPAPSENKVSAFVTIMEGCDKFCTFCVVPYTRGEELSRPVDDVLKECQQQLALGAKEITLLGQNVNGYRGLSSDGEQYDFAMLLEAVAELEGLHRLRFTTSHPTEVNEGMIRAFSELPVLMPYLHLPFQSGSNRILSAMHRGHTREEYLTTIRALKKANPKLVFSTDIIVGFPGETDADFEDSLSLAEEVGFDTAYCFNYSPRPGTPASRIEDDVAKEVKDERLQRLLSLMRAQTRTAMESMLGQDVEVLVERSDRDGIDLQGRTPDFKIVHFSGSHRLIGEIVSVRINKAFGQSLRGEIITSETIGLPQ